VSGSNAAVVVEHILLRMYLKFYNCSASGGSAARVTVGRQKCSLDGQISYPPALLFQVKVAVAFAERNGTLLLSSNLNQ